MWSVADSEKQSKHGSVKEWLMSIGMEQHVTVFEHNGFDTKTTLTILDESMLEGMGITAMAHKVLILKSLGK